MAKRTFTMPCPMCGSAIFTTDDACVRCGYADLETAEKNFKAKGAIKEITRRNQEAGKFEIFGTYGLFIVGAIIVLLFLYWLTTALSNVGERIAR